MMVTVFTANCCVLAALTIGFLSMDWLEAQEVELRCPAVCSTKDLPANLLGEVNPCIGLK